MHSVTFSELLIISLEILTSANRCKLSTFPVIALVLHATTFLRKLRRDNKWCSFPLSVNVFLISQKNNHQVHLKCITPGNTGHVVFK